jgi:uncharacterized protein
LILYLDSSALVKLYAEEPGTEEVRNVTSDATVVAVSEIGYVEARSALARKEREGAFSAEEHDEAVDSLRRDFWELYLPRPLTGGIIAHAGELAREHALRAYDAVHLATALSLRNEAREISARRQETTRETIREGDEFWVRLMSYDSLLIRAAREEAFVHEPESPSPGGGEGQQ